MSTITIGGKEIPAIAIAIGLPVVAALYVGYVGYFAEESLMTRYDAIMAQEAGIADKQAQAEELKQRTKEIDQIKADTEALQKSITLLKSKIPGEAQVPVLLYDIERMAKASEGSLDSFKPGELRIFGSEAPAGAAPPPPPPAAPAAAPGGAPAEGGGAAAGAAGGTAPAAAARPATSDILEMPVTIQAAATYPQVIKFLDQLSTYERKLSISNLSLSPGATTGGGAGQDPGKQAITFKNTLKVEFTLSAYVLRRSGGQP